jgi:hypothetical protein
MKLDEDMSGSDMIPFPREDTVITVYGGILALEARRVSELSLGPPTRCGRGRGAKGFEGTNFPLCVCVNMNITSALKSNNNNNNRSKRR